MIKMKKNAIITASDKNYGDFLIDHWLRSLKDNVDLEDCDIAVIDFGLTTAQKFSLKQNGVIIIPGVRDGHVAVIRFRDAIGFLEKNEYDQILMCDSGDIIFQADISHLFNEHGEDYRAAYEHIKTLYPLPISAEYYDKKHLKQLKKSTIKNRLLNAGFLLGPRLKMIDLCKAVDEIVLDKTKFGPDQFVVNYILHKTGFSELDSKYNCVITTAKEQITAKNGKISYSSGEIIPVVHNAGNLKFMRPLKHFGYGPGHNILKKDIYTALRVILKTNENLLKPQEYFIKSREEIEDTIKKTRDEYYREYDERKKRFEERVKQAIDTLFK
jgi:hypothetical protein